MIIGHLEVFVADPSRSKDFYRDVLNFEVGDVQHDGRIVWMTKGDVTILLRPGKPPAAPDYQHTGVAFVLYTNDLDREREALEARGLVFKGTDGDERCLTFTDPDGNWFQLVNPEEQ